jgi:hypothetical protein
MKLRKWSKRIKNVLINSVNRKLKNKIKTSPRRNTNCHNNAPTKKQNNLQGCLTPDLSSPEA